VLARWARRFAGHARRVAVTFSNNLDYPLRNALDLKCLLGLEARGPEGAAPPERHGVPGAPAHEDRRP
jgi:hypothetical protein